MEGSWTTLFFSTYIFHLLWLIASLLPASRNSDLALGKCVSSVCVYYVFYHAVSGVISLLFFRFIIKYTEVSKSNAIFIRFYGLIVSLQVRSKLYSSFNILFGILQLFRLFKRRINVRNVLFILQHGIFSSEV